MSSACRSSRSGSGAVICQYAREVPRSPGEALYCHREEPDDPEHEILKCVTGERNVLVVALHPADAVDPILLKKDERLPLGDSVCLFLDYPGARRPLLLSSDFVSTGVETDEHGLVVDAALDLV